IKSVAGGVCAPAVEGDAHHATTRDTKASSTFIARVPCIAPHTAATTLRLPRLLREWRTSRNSTAAAGNAACFLDAAWTGSKMIAPVALCVAAFFVTPGAYGPAVKNGLGDSDETKDVPVCRRCGPHGRGIDPYCVHDAGGCE